MNNKDSVGQMTYLILIISIIQGITEFLPISSSAHLILLPQAVGFEDQGQIIDVADLGTLIAVVLYFWGDKNVFLGSGAVQGQLHTRNAQRGIIATISQSSLARS